MCLFRPFPLQNTLERWKGTRAVCELAIFSRASAPDAVSYGEVPVGEKMASTSVACPLCLHPSFNQTNTMLAAFLNFLQRPLRCPLCEFEAVDQTTLILHVVKHLTESMAIPSKSFQYSCKQCNAFHCQEFSELTSHVESEHPDRKFICSHCCKLFKGSFRLS